MYEEKKYRYTINGSMENGPLYRTDVTADESFIYKDGTWEPCDRYFWAQIGDDCTEITQAEAEEYIKNFSN